MASNTHQLKNNTWFNRLCFRLNNIRKLGFNYLVGGSIVTGGKEAPQREMVKNLQKRFGVEIDYYSEVINGKKLQKVIVKPKEGKTDHVTLLYQGHGVTTARQSLLENMIEHVIRGNRTVVAYDQSGVGGSSNYRHSSEYTLREDVQVQAENTYQYLQSLKKSGVVRQTAKMDIYGLCFGGVLSAIAADQIKNKPDFAQATISRAPAKLWEMAALCRDYRLFFPHLGLDPLDTRASKKSNQTERSWWVKAGQAMIHAVTLLVVWILNLKTYLPDLIRRVMIYPVFASVGWCLDVTQALKNVDNAQKLKVLSLNTFEEGSDEFVAACVDMGNVAKNPVALTYLAPSDKTKPIYERFYNQQHGVQKAFIHNQPGTSHTPKAEIKGQGFKGYWDTMINHQPETVYKHQAWSTTLFCRKNFFCPHVDELAVAVHEGESNLTIADNNSKQTKAIPL